MSKAELVQCDVEELSYLLMQVGERAARGMAAMMRDEAEKIVEKARSNAPVDKHNLEQAIKMREIRGGRDPLSGKFARARFEIYIDGTIEDNDGKPVSEYAMIMHEELAPYGAGFYNLGPASQAKASSGNDVGGKFLERAVDERRAIIAYKSRQIADRATRS